MKYLFYIEIQSFFHFIIKQGSHILTTMKFLTFSWHFDAYSLPILHQMLCQTFCLQRIIQNILFLV